MGQMASCVQGYYNEIIDENQTSVVGGRGMKKGSSRIQNGDNYKGNKIRRGLLS